MLCLCLKSTDPFFNLAVDEYLLKNRSEDFLVLSVNSPSVIIGKHQVAHREADTAFVTANSIPVIRRISGGGAVYHDEGNLNFSFVLQSAQGTQVDFRKYTLPVIGFLSTLGVDARFESKNDLKVNGLKISGNAEHVFRQRVLHHGTLLFDANLGLLKNSLRKDTSAYLTRAVSSNPSHVMNLRGILDGMDMNRFISLMIEFFLERNIENELAELTDAEISVIRSLADSKYRSWEWNYAYGPDYQFNKSFEFEGKPHHCSMQIKDGIISECRIEGSPKLEALAEKLEGCKHMVEDVKDVLMTEKLNFRKSVIQLFF